mgnify:CR=1 FL=1
MKSDTKIGIFVVLLLVAVVVVLLGREVMNRKHAAGTPETVAANDEGTDADYPAPSEPSATPDLAGVKDEVAGQDPAVAYIPEPAPATGLEPAAPGTASLPAVEVPAPDAMAGLPPPVAAPQEVVVQPGDTLEKISKQVYGRKSQWKLIAEANPGINPSNLKVGAKLVIPPAPAVSPSVPPGSSMDAGMMVAGIGKTYTVRSGDTLEKISKQAYGKKSQWKAIAAANPGINPANLKIGAVLSIPEAPVAEAPAVSARPPAKASSSEPWKTPGGTKLVTTPARSGG